MLAIFNVDWMQAGENMILLAIAYILAMPIGWNRERSTAGAGIRTFSLVSVASCGFMLAGLSKLTDADAMARLAYGVITGVGFIGGGAIVKASGQPQGTATAAGIWCTGAIGMAVAWKRLDIAVLLCLFTGLTFALKSKEPGPKGNSPARDHGREDT